MKLILELPLLILSRYHGVSNLDETLDNNITYLIGKYFYDHDIKFKILNLDWVKPQPNINDELIRYEVEVGVIEHEFKSDWILKELENEGYEKGLTIKSEHGKVIYVDPYTADIQLRRKMKKY